MRVIPLILASLLTVVPGVLHAAEEFKIATLAPDGSSWMNDMRAAAEEVEKLTEGRVTFRFYPGGVMGNDQSVLRKMRIGQLHGATFTSGGLAGVYPDLLVYSQPFLFRDLAEVDYVRERMDPVLRQGLEKAGFVNFGFAEGGFAKIMALKPIRNSADLDNEKAWIPEGDDLSYQVIKELGVSPVTLPITDVLTGLQTGLISVIAASPLGAIAFQWHSRISYMTDEPLVYLTGILAISDKSFNRLSESDRAIVRKVFDDLYARMDKRNRADNLAAQDALENQNVTFVQVDAEALPKWRATAERVGRRMATEGKYSIALTDKVYELVNQYRAAHAEQ